MGVVTQMPSNLSLPLINDTDMGFSGRYECSLGDAVVDRSRRMVLTILISSYITSDFSTVLPVSMVTVITAPAIVPVDFSADVTSFVSLTAPQPHYNTTPETSQSLASLAASEYPFNPESLSFYAAPVFLLAPNLYSDHPPVPGILPSCTSAPTAPLRKLWLVPFT